MTLTGIHNPTRSPSQRSDTAPGRPESESVAARRQMRTIFLYFRPAVERPRLLIQVSAPTAAFESAPAQAANRGPLQAEILQLCYGMI